jgi:hypothetical protein
MRKTAYRGQRRGRHAAPITIGPFFRVRPAAHLTGRPHSSGRASAGVTALLLAAVLALTTVFASVGASPASYVLRSHNVFGCAGKSLVVTPVDKDSVTLTCVVAQAANTGGARRYSAGSTHTATTALPTGTVAGSLLLSTVETKPGIAVTFPAGWTRAYSTANGASARLTTWWHVAKAGDPLPTATLSPAGAVSMLTISFAETDSTHPVSSAAAVAGLTSPYVARGTNGAVLLTQGSAGHGTATAPAGTTAARSVTNARASQVAVAVSTGLTKTSARTWRLSPSAASVGGAVSVAATPPAALADKAASVAPGTAHPFACQSRTLTTKRLNATTVDLMCGTWTGPSPTATSTSPTTPPTSTTTSSSTSSSTSTTSTSSSSTTSTSTSSSSSSSSSSPPGSAPKSPTSICGSSALNGPSTAPAGSVTVTPAQNLGTVADNAPAGTSFWLAPGTYHLGTGQYDQVTPQNGQTFTGAPGAIIDGQHKNLYAFTGKATNVTVQNLTIQNFGSAGTTNNEGVVNHDAGTGWKMLNNTIQTNAGAGAFLGNSDTLNGNCLRNNGQYGFSSYLPDGVVNLTVSGNEISGNNTDNWEVRQPGCGCTGGGKFWDTKGATVTNNYVHNNRGVGLWADTNNTGFLFSGNYIADNDNEGLMYEISYNAAITNNTFIRNAIVEGPTNTGFPSGAIYLSESGSDPRAGSTYGSSFEISGNVFTDNWAGIIAWENADRFAGSPANSSSGYTTLVNPGVATESACGVSANIAKSPFFDDCRWKTQNIKVHDNTFNLTPSNVSPKCTAANGCGYNGLFSNYGTYPSWSPFKAEIVEDHITFSQHNVWSNNTYTGPWSFMIHAMGDVVPWSTWRGTTYGQDAGSTLNGS